MCHRICIGIQAFIRHGRRSYLVHDADAVYPVGRGRPRKNPLGIVPRHKLLMIAQRACEDCINPILLTLGMVNHLCYVNIITIHQRIGYVQLVLVSSLGTILFILKMKVVGMDQVAGKCIAG